MKRLLIIMLTICVWTNNVCAQFHSMNYDKETVAAMATAFGAEAVAEGYYSEQVPILQQSWQQQGFSPVSFWNARQ